MSWTVYSRSDAARWLNWGGRDWKADPETTARLNTPGFSFPLTPTGPIQSGFGPGESELLAAALFVIPTAATAGELPEYPPLPPGPPGAVL